MFMATTTMYPGAVLANTGQIILGSSDDTASFDIIPMYDVETSGISDWALAFVKLDYGDDLIGQIDVAIPLLSTMVNEGELTGKHDVFVSVGEGYTVTRVIITVKLADYTGTITVAPYGGAGIKVSNVKLNFLALIH